MPLQHTIELPTDKDELALSIRQHGDRCDLAYMIRRTNWLLAWYYLNGYRRFDVYNPVTGALTPHILDSDGNTPFQSTELLYQINQVAGRIQSMDLRPKIETQGFSLAGQRNMACNQIIADSIFGDDTITKCAETWAYLFTCLGFAGISSTVHDHPTIGLTAEPEVIHPRELFPFPLVGQDFTKVFGLYRQRWVPLHQLRKSFKLTRSDLAQMEWFEIPAGEDWAGRDGAGVPGYRSSLSGPHAAPGGPMETDENKIGVAKLRELWVHGPRGTVTRYVASSGNKILADEDTLGMDVYSPIGWARFFNNGTFHGAGLFDLLFSQHRQLEKLSASLYSNIQSLDQYGVLVLPQGQMNQRNLLQDVGRGLRVMFWDPDATAEGIRPFAIQPWNTGEMPGRVAQFARESMQAVNPIRDLLEEKGRVDSATGLQFLEEQATKALTSPTSGVGQAWGTMYRGGVQSALSQITITRRPIPVGSVTLDLAGAVINDDDTITFDRNPVPDMARLRFTIRAFSPRSSLVRKQEALDLWARGVEQDPLSFRIFACKEGLDFAMNLDEYRNAYEMAVRAVLTLFNDGETPGVLILTPHTTRPEVAIQVFNTFACGPLMQKASPAVFDAFEMARLTLTTYLGATLPPSMPNIEDAAEDPQAAPSDRPPLSLAQ